MRRKVLKGVFRCSKLTPELEVKAKAETLTLRFMAEQRKMGWQFFGKPILKKIRFVDELSLPDKGHGVRGGVGGVWHPKQLFEEAIMPDQHPLAQTVEAGEDLYIVWLPVGMRDDGKRVTLEVKDSVIGELLAEGKLQGVEIS